MLEQKSYLSELNQEQQEKFRMFAELLLEANKHLNLTRITEPREIELKHFEDSLVAIPILRKIQSEISHEPSLIDIGSGGGFPGLPLAIALPQWRIISIEATGKKAEFQQIIADRLGLTNVEIFSDRAESLASEFDFREQFDVATSRAVGHLSIISELAFPFVRKNGKFLAWKGPKLEEERISGEKALKILGAGEISELPYALPDQKPEESGYRILEAIKEKNTPGLYPRDFREIKSKPLGS